MFLFIMQDAVIVKLNIINISGNNALKYRNSIKTVHFKLVRVEEVNIT